MMSTLCNIKKNFKPTTVRYGSIDMKDYFAIRNIAEVRSDDLSGVPTESAFEISLNNNMEWDIGKVT